MAHWRARWCWTACLGAAVLLQPTASFGYVRGVNANQQPKYWSASCVTVEIFTNGFSGLTRDEVAKSVAAAAEAWGPSSIVCPATASAPAGPPSIEIIPFMAPPDVVGRAAPDFNNQIVFDTATWDQDPRAVAGTSTPPDSAGRIADGDIEINATPGIVWANLDPGAAPPHNGVLRYDLQSILTHEFGHFLGLAHTCYAASSSGQASDAADMPTNLADDRGDPVPACSDPPDQTNSVAAQAVMWYVVHQEDTSRRTLTEDEVRAVCAIYPPTSGPSTCDVNLSDDGCGCRTTDPRGPNGKAVILTVALGLFGARRRRR